MKPIEYSHLCVIAKDTPYQVEAGQPAGPQTSAGTLHVGRCVWVQHTGDGRHSTVPAYVEGIGIIALNLDSVENSATSSGRTFALSEKDTIQLSGPKGISQLSPRLVGPPSKEGEDRPQQSGTIESFDHDFAHGHLTHDQSGGTSLPFSSDNVELGRSLSVGESVSFDLVQHDAEQHPENIQRTGGDLEGYQDMGGLYS